MLTHFVSGFLSGVAASALTIPFDVVKTCMST